MQTLKRFVLLSSAVAVLNSYEDDSALGGDYSEKDWNPVGRLSLNLSCVGSSSASAKVTVEDAIQRQDAVLGYNASKKMAELAAWNFVRDSKPNFDLTVINPDIVIGPMLHPVPGPQSVNETNRFAIYNFLNGTHGAIENTKFPFYHFVSITTA